jgi:hypothetical protein
MVKSADGNAASRWGMCVSEIRAMAAITRSGGRAEGNNGEAFKNTNLFS